MPHNASINKRTESDLLVGQHVSGRDKERQPGKATHDNLVVAAFQTPDDLLSVLTLAIVTHGLGGHNTDEPYKAANLVIASLVDTFARHSTRNILPLLSQGFDTASLRIAETFKEGGATCSAAVIVSRKLYVASCGNCRIMLIRNHHVTQIAVAHAFADMLVEQKLISWDDIENHPFDPPTTVRMLGNEGSAIDLRLRLTDEKTDDQSLENQGLPLLPDDRILLLSSDKFGNSMVPDLLMTIGAAFSDLYLPPQTAVDHFVQQIRQSDSHHALAIVLLQMPTEWGREER